MLGLFIVDQVKPHQTLYTWWDTQQSTYPDMSTYSPIDEEVERAQKRYFVASRLESLPGSSRLMGIF